MRSRPGPAAGGPAASSRARSRLRPTRIQVIEETDNCRESDEKVRCGHGHSDRMLTEKDPGTADWPAELTDEAANRAIHPQLSFLFTMF
jgi:hypothetical protein